MYSNQNLKKLLNIENCQILQMNVNINFNLRYKQLKTNIDYRVAQKL